MTLDLFKTICSEFHNYAGTFGDKDRDICHHPQYFICPFNVKTKMVLTFVQMFVFMKEVFFMRLKYYPVRMYNKDKPDKFCVDLFIMVDSKHYFIYYLDVY